MKRAKIIPFKVESVEKHAEEIPYGVKQLEAPRIWQKGEKGDGIVIAILDTGVDVSHPDLKDQIIGGKNFSDDGAEDDFNDGNGHGTHVAGIIAAAETDTGVVGVAPQAKLLIVKVLGNDGSGSYESIINGLKFVQEWKGPNGEKVRIVNMSLGGPEDDPDLHQAILDTVAKGIMVCVASGNEGDDNEGTFEYGYPALYNECIEVAACDQEKKLAYFSNNNLQVDVIAAGVNVLSTYKDGQYAKLSGTSMATPHVSGALALIIKKGEERFKRELSESEIYGQLVRCCASIGYKPSSEGNGSIHLSYLYKKNRF